MEKTKKCRKKNYTEYKSTHLHERRGGYNCTMLELPLTVYLNAPLGLSLPPPFRQSLHNQESRQIDSKALICFSALSSIVVSFLFPYSLIFQYFNKGIREYCIRIFATKGIFENKVFRYIIVVPQARLLDDVFLRRDIQVVFRYFCCSVWSETVHYSVNNAPYAMSRTIMPSS